jgi:hypothetical protein
VRQVGLPRTKKRLSAAVNVGLYPDDAALLLDSWLRGNSTDDERYVVAVLLSEALANLRTIAEMSIARADPTHGVQNVEQNLPINVILKGL